MVSDDTRATLRIDEPFSGAVTTTVMSGATTPAPSTGRVHVTDTSPLFAHDHPVPSAETKVTPSGRVSVTVSAFAPDGPWLVTEST